MGWASHHDTGSGIGATSRSGGSLAIGDVTWDAIVAFAANPVFDETAPEIKTIAQLGLEPAASGTAYGEATVGLDHSSSVPDP